MAEITYVINDLNTNRAGKHTFMNYVGIAHRVISSEHSTSGT